MRTSAIIVTIALTLAGCSNFGGGHEGHEHHTHERHAHQGKAEEHENAKEHAAHGEIILHSEIAERFGVRVDTARRGDFVTVIEASGIVMPSTTSEGVVTAPTAGIVRFAPGVEPGRDVSRGSVLATIDARDISGGDVNAASAAALAAAEREFRRIETLYKEKLATVGEYNAALAAYEQAKAGYSSTASTGRATSPIAGVVSSLNVSSGQYVSAGDIIARVASNTSVTLRVDLPQKYYLLAPSLSDATVEFAYLPSPVQLGTVGGKRVGNQPLPSPGATAAYIPIYFSVPGSHGIIPGSSFSAHLLGNERHDVLTVPNSAILEQQGESFVFEKLDEECYTKHRVKLGADNGLRTEIIEGLSDGTPFVSSGVTTVRLAESGAAIPEGHTHNH